MPTRITNIGTCITQVTLKVVHYAMLINHLRFRLTFVEVLANFLTHKYWLNCSMGLKTSLFQLSLNKVGRILLLKGYNYPSHVTTRHFRRGLRWLWVSNPRANKTVTGGVDKVLRVLHTWKQRLQALTLLRIIKPCRGQTVRTIKGQLLSWRLDVFSWAAFFTLYFCFLMSALRIQTIHCTILRKKDWSNLRFKPLSTVFAVVWSLFSEFESTSATFLGFLHTVAWRF